MYTTTPVLTVANCNWGCTSLTAIHAVLASAADVLIQAFETMPDDRINVAWWSDDPMVFDDHRPYELRLNARDTYWSQYVYQFSHELCHILTNFDRFKGHRHRWLDETLCELASLFVLHRLADLWVARPPANVPGAADFAPNHGRYAEQSAERQHRPPLRDLPLWFSNNIGKLEQNRYERGLCGTVAVLLLDNFRADPTLWSECGHLNQWDPRTNPTFRDYLDSWASHLLTRGIEPRSAALVRRIFQVSK